jgi:DNA-binding NarL/FixJ family response regulator
MAIAQRRGLRALIPDFALQLADLRLLLDDPTAARAHAAMARPAAEGMDSDHLLSLTGKVECRSGVARETTGTDPSAQTAVPPPDADAAVGEDLGTLSRREYEIAMLVSHGCTNYQIARRLGLSHKTVETYLSRIFKKLIVSSRAEVATIVGRAGIGHRRAGP